MSSSTDILPPLPTSNKRARVDGSISGSSSGGYQPAFEILDDGVVHFQACTVNMEMVKKTFKDLHIFLPDLRVRFLPTREIEIFNHNDATQDMVYCSIQHFDHFQCLDDSRVFEFSVRAKTISDIVSKMPMSMVVIFYLSESCIDVDGSVMKIGLRGVCTETGKTIEHKISTNVLDMGAAAATTTTTTTSPSDVTAASVIASPSAMQFSRWLSDREPQYSCEITWNTRDLNESIENLANLKEARWVSITATGGDVCEIETDTNTTSSCVRQTHMSRKYSFERFGKDAVVTNKFRLRSLQDFLKCKDLCADVSVLLDSEFPLVMKFVVPNFGTLCMYTPIFQKNED